MEAVIAKLTAEQIILLSGWLMFTFFATFVGVALSVRSAVVGYSYYKYRAKKRRKLVTVEVDPAPVENRVPELATA